MYLYYENEEVLKKHYQVLSKNQVELTKINNQKYEGTINLDNDEQYIMFTIPYENGWKVTVDGKEVEVEKILDALMAIKLDSGEHKICLEYRPTGIIVGSILTFIGIIMFLTFVVMSKKINLN